MRLWLALLLLLGMSLPVQAADLDYSDFRRLPVLEDGRLKPLESFAGNMQHRLSGRTSQPAAWLAQVMFDPGSADDVKTFRVANPHVRAALGLAESDTKLYSLTDLIKGLSATADQAEQLSRRPPAELTTDERDLLDLHMNALAFNQLLQSLSALLPLPAIYEGGAPTYIEAQRNEQELTQQLQASMSPEARDNPELLTPDQQRLAVYLMTLDRLRKAAQNNFMLRIIPDGWAAGSGEWLSPWQVLLAGQGSPQTRAYLEDWQKLASAYRAGDAAGWQQAASALHSQLGTSRLDTEVLYLTWRPYDAAVLALLVAGVLAALALRRPGLYGGGWWLLALGEALLVVALAGRIYILDRPPVGTLYESMLFVASIVGLGALYLTRQQRQPAFLLSSSIGVLVILLVAPFIKQDNESLTMLTAVLNTNFWLTVHVLCITAGYGACILAALVAHVLLALHGTRHDQTARLPVLHYVSLWALLLTAVGTLLGGVWADQSWGRFWGWDPKENGALVIVLWLIWVQHARLAGQFGKLGYMVGMALLSVVVAQAWFGVNLLSTGLHSYGFIQGVATGLFAFTAVELMLVGLLYALARRRLHAA